MHGNVWEWCNDWYEEDISATRIDPHGTDTGTIRVLRGGCWISYARFCRSAYRYDFEPGFRFDDTGLRFVRGQKKQETGSGPGEGLTADKRSVRGATPNKGRGGDGRSLWSKIFKKGD